MKIRLKDAFDLQMGKTPARNTPAYWNGSYKWVSIADIGSAGKYITATKEGITDKAITESGIRAVPAHTVIMSFKLSIGKTAITSEKMYTNEAIMAFVDNGTYDIDTNYLYHLCCGTRWTEGTNKAVMGLTLNKATLSEKRISLPEITEQRNIAAKFDALDNVIEKTQAELSSLDQLVKSRFVEMFGDPFHNPFGWKEIKISEVLGGRVSNGYFAKREDYVADGNVAVLGVANVVNRMYSQCAELPRTNASLADIEKYRLQYGDMLFCRSSLVAEGIGKASIVPRTVQPNTLFECHVIRLPLNLNLCVPEYMQVLTTTEYFRQQILSQAKTATMTTIGQEGILKSLVLLPPLDLQQQFLSFIAEVDKSKLAVKQSLEKLETLKKSLMQQYFG